MTLQSNLEHVTGGCAEVPRLIVDATTRGVPTRPQPIKIVVYPGRRGVGNVGARVWKKNHVNCVFFTNTSNIEQIRYLQPLKLIARRHNLQYNIVLTNWLVWPLCWSGPPQNLPDTLSPHTPHPDLLWWCSPVHLRPRSRRGPPRVGTHSGYRSSSVRTSPVNRDMETRYINPKHIDKLTLLNRLVSGDIYSRPRDSGYKSWFTVLLSPYREWIFYQRIIKPQSGNQFQQKNVLWKVKKPWIL